MSLLRTLALVLVRKLLPETTGPGTALALRQSEMPLLPGPGYAPTRTVYPQMIYAPPVQPAVAPPPRRRRKVTVSETIYSERKW